MNIKSKHKVKIVQVDTAHVNCNGGGGVLGHPTIYLRIKEGEKSIVCPYCSVEFKLKNKNESI
jgi:uncharacterized Zn-finger protein